MPFTPAFQPATRSAFRPAFAAAGVVEEVSYTYTGDPRAGVLHDVGAVYEASTTFNAVDYQPEYAVDDSVRDITGIYASADTPSNWWQCNFGNSKFCVDTYAIEGRPNGSNIRNWQLQGSNDDIQWDVIDTREDNFQVTNSTAGVFVIPIKPLPYKYIRVQSTGVNQGGSNILILGEIDLFGTLS